MCEEEADPPVSNAGVPGEDVTLACQQAGLLALGRLQVVPHLHRVVLRDVAGRPVEHPALPGGRHLHGRDTGAGGQYCAGAGCFSSKTVLNIPAVPGP